MGFAFAAGQESRSRRKFHKLPYCRPGPRVRALRGPRTGSGRDPLLRFSEPSSNGKDVPSIMGSCRGSLDPGCAGSLLRACERIPVPLSFSLPRRKPGPIAQPHERFIGWQVVAIAPSTVRAGGMDPGFRRESGRGLGSSRSALPISSQALKTCERIPVALSFSLPRRKPGPIAQPHERFIGWQVIAIAPSTVRAGGMGPGFRPESGRGLGSSRSALPISSQALSMTVSS
jgi:hypothetical protein